MRKKKRIPKWLTSYRLKITDRPSMFDECYGVFDETGTGGGGYSTYAQARKELARMRAQEPHHKFSIVKEITIREVLYVDR